MDMNMKYITIFKVTPSDLCEWVDENSQKGEKNPNLMVNTFDLDNDAIPYIRVAEVSDDAEVEIIKDRVIPITELDLTEWVAFDSLSYDDELGLMWSA